MRWKLAGAQATKGSRGKKRELKYRVLVLGMLVRGEKNKESGERDPLEERANSLCSGESRCR